MYGKRETSKPTVFFMAGGKAARCGGTIKQLLPLHEEPLIDRLVRQVREITPDSTRYIVTWREELVRSDCTTIPIPHTSCIGESILHTREYWGDYNIFLVTDAYLPDESMKTIISGKEEFMIYGNMDTYKHESERFAIAVSSSRFPDFLHGLSESIRLCANVGGIRQIATVINHPWYALLLWSPLPFPLYHIRDFVHTYIMKEWGWYNKKWFTQIEGIDIDSMDEYERLKTT